MKIVAFIAALIVGTAHPSFAQKRLFMLAGSGLNAQLEQAVINNFGNLAKSFTPLGWTSETYFGDGRTLKGFPADLKGVQHMERELSNIHSGKVLIYIDGHGFNRRADKGEITHSIPLEEGSYSLDNLFKIEKQLVSSGVLVTIVDVTCYSGHSQALTISGVCVISAASKDYFSEGMSEQDEHAFDQMFAKALQQNPNLSIEEMFLKARLVDMRNLPQISSLETPDAEFLSFLLKELDPHSSVRQLSNPGGACYYCAVNDYYPFMMAKREELNRLPQIAEHVLQGDLLEAFNKEKVKLKLVLEDYQEISKVLIQHDPIPNLPAGLSVPITGYEGWSEANLLYKYKILVSELFTRYAYFKATESVFYHQYYTGEAGYRPGQTIVRQRRNGDCAKFKPR